MSILRTLWALCALSMLCCCLPAAAGEPTVIDLWPESVTAAAPIRGPERNGNEGRGVGAVSNISRARMAVYRPDKPNGAVVLILGGGGYFRIQISNESLPTARWLNAIGVTAAVLYYRLPADGWPAVADRKSVV